MHQRRAFVVRAGPEGQSIDDGAGLMEQPVLDLHDSIDLAPAIVHVPQEHGYVEVGVVSLIPAGARAKQHDTLNPSPIKGIEPSPEPLHHLMVGLRHPSNRGMSLLLLGVGFRVSAAPRNPLS